MLLYPHQPQGPARRPRGPAPDGGELDRHHHSISDHSHGPACGRRTHFQELRSYRQLVVSLAEELYRRERGAMPPSEEALVGHVPQGPPRGRFGRARRRHGADRARFRGRRRDAAEVENQARISWTTSPWTSVSRFPGRSLDRPSRGPRNSTFESRIPQQDLTVHPCGPSTALLEASPLRRWPATRRIFRAADSPCSDFRIVRQL